MKNLIRDKISQTFRALHSKNYRMFFFGQCISLVGSWIQNIAMTWLVYSLTHNALAMGTIMFINSIPSVLLSPFAGVIIDRIDKYKALIIVQIFFGLEALILSLLTISGKIQIWHIIVLGLFVSTNMAFDMPLRQAFVIQLVDDKKDLGNAISLNSSSFNLARLIGPSIAGMLIAAVGEGICFLINSLSYIAVVWALLNIKVQQQIAAQGKKTNFLAEFKEGITYAKNCNAIKYILIFLTITSFIGMSYPLLMPIFSEEILKGGAQTLGFLMSAAGVGALYGSLRIASKDTIKGLPKWLFAGAMIMGVSMASLGFLPVFSLSLVFMFFVGFGTVSALIAANTLLQHIVDDDKRGRIMSLYTIAFTGTAPLSNLAAGAAASRAGVLNTFMLFGLTMLIISYLFINMCRKNKIFEKTKLSCS